MVFCNLAVLLAERKKKISKVSADTGISRTTLTSLVKNNWQGVRADTIDALCKYLGVAVGDIFQYFPFDIEVVGCQYDKWTSSASITFHCNTDKFHGHIDCKADIAVRQLAFHGMCCVTIRLEENGDMEAENIEMRKIFASMPIVVSGTVSDQISDIILGQIMQECIGECDGEGYDYPKDMASWVVEFCWPDEWKEKW